MPCYFSQQATGRIAGMDVTIFNPSLDTGGEISKDITELIVHSFPGKPLSP